MPVAPEMFEKEHLNSIDFSRVRSEMSGNERAFVNGLIRYHRPVNILEIGVSSGGGTVNLLNAISDIPASRLISVDRFTNYYKDANVLNGSDVDIYADRLPLDRWKLVLNKDVCDVLPGLEMRFDFVVLDTTHRIPGEILAFLTVLPYLNDGAIVVMHDYSLSYKTEDAIAPRLLFATLVGEKRVPQNVAEGRYNNIAAVQIGPDTRKHIANVFQALALPWSRVFTPGAEDLAQIRALLSKHYDGEKMAYVDEAINRYSLRLTLDQFAKNIVFYGAGKNMRGVLHFLTHYQIPFDYPIWDIDADNINDINGHKVTKPDFESRVHQSAAIITIDDRVESEAVAARLVELGFTVLTGKGRFIEFFHRQFFEWLPIGDVIWN